jgi:2-polyprenyl-3-methyl-5-hydroxy-6-metoxy-1,4-benzoquinol methylase
MIDHVASDYGWQDASVPPSFGVIVPRIMEVLKKLNVRRILDLGAGNGALCAQLASAGYQVVGVEYDKKGVELATSTHPAIPFYNFGVHDNPSELLAREQPFDVVVSTEVVEHLFSPHLLPIYAKGALKEGGYLVVTTPYHGYLKNLILSILGAWDSHHTSLRCGGHIKFWSRATLTRLLAETGFRVLDFSGVGRLPWLWKSMVVVAEYKPPA